VTRSPATARRWYEPLRVAAGGRLEFAACYSTYVAAAEAAWRDAGKSRD